MNKRFSYLIIPIILSLAFTSCSNDSETLTPVPTETYDSTEFTNITSRLPGWAFDYQLYDIEIIGSKMWLSCANDNYILISQDSGKTFSKINTNGKIVHHMQFLPDGLTGYLWNEKLLKTTDGGFTWDSILINLEYIKGLQFLNSSAGVLIGNTDTSKYIAVTTNSGVNWSYRNFSLGHPNYLLTSLCIPDTLNPSTIYIGTDRGLFTSSNSGVSWQKTFFPPGDPHLMRINYWKKGSFWICGKNGILYSNINSSWKGYKLNSADIITAVSSSYSGGLIVAPADMNYYLYMSTNNGASFITRNFGRNVTGSLNGVRVVNDSLAYIIGDRSLFFMYKRK
jgi:photosystem II stability/assembly factor-like uncharacterized protein